MAHDGQNKLLNNAQKNSLAVTLRLLEERILELKKLQSEQHIAGLLFRFENDVPSDQLPVLERNFDYLLELVEKGKQKFDLPERTTTFSSYLQAFTSYFWSLLMDEKSDKLARYGNVASGLKEELDPLIEQLIDQLQAIDNCQK
ncbi:MAG: hypothetical protein MUC94_07420 [bacterium]|jgi:hypothetical protein|nr:hypothetical protein [bacterium]